MMNVCLSGVCLQILVANVSYSLLFSFPSFFLFFFFFFFYSPPSSFLFLYYFVYLLFFVLLINFDEDIRHKRTSGTRIKCLPRDLQPFQHPHPQLWQRSFYQTLRPLFLLLKAPCFSRFSPRCCLPRLLLPYQRQCLPLRQ